MRLAEDSVSIAARRLRRVRRLAQRAKEGQLASLWNVGFPVSAPAVLAGFLAVALVVALWRSSIPAAVEEPTAVEAVTYTAEDLRPRLAPPEAPTFPEPARHVVEEGDTLLAIGYELDSTSELVTVANNLGEEPLLSIGQELVVPPAASVLESVDPGSALGEIAESHSIPVEVVAVYNSMSVDLLDEPVDRPVVVLPPPRVSPSASEESAAAEGGDGSEMTIYTIAEGDTILSIAQQLGVDPESIVAANRLGDSALIVAGNALEIPLWSRPAEGQGGDEEPRGPFVYEISPGDTLLALASRFGVDVDTIKNNNGVSDANMIRPGDQIMILPVSGLLYNVAEGDTLSSIAQKFQVDMGPIIDFNYLDDVDSISVGTELILPGANPLPPPPPAAPTLPTSYQVAPGDTVSTIAARFG
ncbi:MAG: LysM peptidoglycan-binding domain-containing protein, partial [Chloroflexi bacterium]|nr:LysM peptidoglycan-binding domain-containing protein [Chloroflexota bacterium]